MKSIFIICFLLFIFILNLNATIINVPSDIDSIQGGINLAVDGDTVLVQPGTYYENINFNGKNIVVGSLTLTTGDTSYISQTIIDGNQNGSVVTFENGEDSTAVLTGFTITNGSVGHYYGNGGGIYISNSHPTISYTWVDNNLAFRGYWHFSSGFGGGIYYSNSNAILSDVVIGDNKSSSGGGIYCDSSNLYLHNVIIKENEALGYGAPTAGQINGNGGGIGINNSSVFLNNVVIKKNYVLGEEEGNLGGCGGGIYSYNSLVVIDSVRINDNTSGFGGGIGFGNEWTTFPGWIPIDSSIVSLSNVTIQNDTASYWGGGIALGSHTRLIFNDTNRCNIYNNRADSSIIGHDLFAQNCDSIIPIIVDTFTVLNPDSSHASPLHMFKFDILHDISGNPNKIERISDIPFEFTLKQNYPNPFNPTTTIEFSIPKAEFVNLKIYNLLGQEVATLVSEKLTPGNYKYNWDAGSLASGVYYYKLESSKGFVKTRKLILLK